jgi:hypothetical protein
LSGALRLNNLCVRKITIQFKLNIMKKFVLAAAMLLAITGFGFAQTAPAAKPAAKTETTKHGKKAHAHKKKVVAEKVAPEKKN